MTKYTLRWIELGAIVCATVMWHWIGALFTFFLLFHSNINSSKGE